MENIPPSYEAAIARDPWKFVAAYIPSSSLCALTRVNHELHEKLSPFLWGNPAAHFTGENDDHGSEYGDRVFGINQLSEKSLGIIILRFYSRSDTVQEDVEESTAQRTTAYAYTAPPTCSGRGKYCPGNLHTREGTNVTSCMTDLTQNGCETSSKSSQTSNL